MNTCEEGPPYDVTVVDLEPLTAAELVTVCLAHGLLCVDPKRPPPTRQDIAATMVAFFDEEKAGRAPVPFPRRVRST